ncbi:prephenate dehydrogenase/arogenate dehydrogenase family protein [Plebeiibacterium marinum]|uniref:Prephenate dehydrogenase/arogenate dehydrogenase family protein n=1 Tax=Plebeiibacterium marinum TaxID=2992111 RepID=A0AAE3MBJ7_9BACT|nr:prephenate dehydrogenase/arogenate dehydrogenase family protein [Plebeiobacterium marinum]MCW3804816.1 prephenate dehydrogenase/arogenate dehydrogenase family protein [Plebeiobacterium marinum]
MKICILGAGKMGTWLTDALCLDHEVAIYDPNLEKLKYIFNTQRLTKLEEITAFEPELLINAVTLKYTIEAFKEVIPYLPKTCIISDISSVKTGFQEFYKKVGMRYVSTHPMFGPTFGNLKALREHHAIIISEGDHLGKAFFKDFFGTLGLNIHEYTFIEHDETIAYSLSIPFSSTLVFASVMKKQEAPGTTFKKHFDIAKGLLSEDDYLLSEILFNPFTSSQVEKIRLKLKELLAIIETKDTDKMKVFLEEVRDNIKE